MPTRKHGNHGKWPRLTKQIMVRSEGKVSEKLINGYYAMRNVETRLQEDFSIVVEKRSGVSCAEECDDVKHIHREHNGEADHIANL